MRIPAGVPGAFSVTARARVRSVFPSVTAQAQTTTLVIQGEGTKFQQGTTSVSISGDGLTIGAITVASHTLLRVEVTSTAGAALTARSVTVTTGAETDTKAAALTIVPYTGTVRGTITQSGGQAAAGVLIRAYRGTPLESFDVTRSDVVGGYEFKRVPGGSFTIVATDIGEKELGTRAGTIPANNAIVTTNVPLSGRANVEVRVVDEAGNPAPNAFVKLSTTAYPALDEFTPIGIRELQAGADGVAVFSDFPAGAVRADVQSSDKGRMGLGTGTAARGASTTLVVRLNAPEVLLRTLSLSPATGRQGEMAAVAATNSFIDFRSTAVLEVSAGEGITVTGSVVSGSNLMILLNISTTAATGPRTLTVRTAERTMSGTFTVEPGTPRILSVTPPTARPGADASFAVLGRFTTWNATSRVTFSGTGISVISVQPTATSLLVQARVAANAEPGWRTLTVTTGPQALTLATAVRVEDSTPVLVSAQPNGGRQGQTFAVAIAGQFTSFAPGVSTVSFGPEVTINSVTVASPTSLTANITIGANAVLGQRNVVVTTGTQVVTRANGFTISASNAVVSSLSPNFAVQGATLPVTIRGSQTSFAQGRTTVDFGPGISVGAVTVSSPVLLTATLTLSPDAMVGQRNVTVTTIAEVARLANGFTVAPLIIALPAGQNEAHSFVYSVANGALSTSMPPGQSEAHSFVYSVANGLSSTSLPPGQSEAHSFVYSVRNESAVVYLPAGQNETTSFLYSLQNGGLTSSLPAGQNETASFLYSLQNGGLTSGLPAGQNETASFLYSLQNGGLTSSLPAGQNETASFLYSLLNGTLSLGLPAGQNEAVSPLLSLKNETVASPSSVTTAAAKSSKATSGGASGSSQNTAPPQK